MDISDTSNSNSSQGYDTSSQVLRLTNPVNNENLDNEKFDNDNISTTAQNKNLSLTQNATNSHPLMYSPSSPISPDYPDLIPQKPKNKNNYANVDNKSAFNPGAHSSANDADLEKSIGSLENSFEKQLDLDIPILGEYNEKLPGKTFILY